MPFGFFEEEDAAFGNAEHVVKQRDYDLESLLPSDLQKAEVFVNPDELSKKREAPVHE